MAVTLTIEDGSGVTGANSYTTVSGVNTYFENLGESDWTGTDTVKANAMLKAMRYLEGLPWKGIKYDQDQALRWPRSDVYDIDRRLVDEDLVPANVIAAQCELALRSLSTSDVELQPDLERGGMVAAESVGSLATSYQTGAPGRTQVTVVEDLLRGYLKSSCVIEINRA